MEPSWDEIPDCMSGHKRKAFLHHPTACLQMSSVALPSEVCTAGTLTRSFAFGSHLGVLVLGYVISEKRVPVSGTVFGSRICFVTDGLAQCQPIGWKQKVEPIFVPKTGTRNRGEIMSRFGCEVEPVSRNHSGLGMAVDVETLSRYHYG